MPEEIKFFCANCGQRLAAEPGWVGMQITCPSCQTLTMVPGSSGAVPQAAPASPPLYYSNPPAPTPPPAPSRPMPQGYQQRPAPRQPIGESGFANLSLLMGVLTLPLFYAGRAVHFPLGIVSAGTAVILGLIGLVQVIAGMRTGVLQSLAGMIIGFLACLIPTAIIMYHQSTSYRLHQMMAHNPGPGQMPMRYSPPTPGSSGSGPSQSTPAKPRVIDPPVKTDPTTIDIPATVVAGTVEGAPFQVNKATLSASTLTLQQMQPGAPMAQVVIFFGQGVIPGASGPIVVKPATATAPQIASIHVHSKTGAGVTAVNYSLRLELGTANGRQISGRIYLELPQSMGTKVAGTFVAQMQ